jgi:hypothetical protein
MADAEQRDLFARHTWSNGNRLIMETVTNARDYHVIQRVVHILGRISFA